MAELTGLSPGVGTREIDLSGPTPTVPTGVPAGIIGTAQKGPAFVPVTVANFSEFAANFGNTDGQKFGPLAANEWFKQAQAGTYVRILGVGDGKKKNSDGSVTRAGFVVGSQEVQPNGLIGANPGVGTVLPFSGALGRTYFLGAFMSASTLDQDYGYPGMFKEANIRPGCDIGGVLALDGDNFPTGSAPILRAVLLAPSGVLLSLSSSAVPENTPSNQQVLGSFQTARTIGGGSAGGFFKGLDNRFDPPSVANEMTAVQADTGHAIGDVNLSGQKQEFVLLINGQKPNGYPNLVTCSFDYKSPNYLTNVLNQDPTKIEDAGHCLYAHYPISRNYAVVTGSGIINQSSVYPTKAIAEQHESCAFILTSSAGRATSTAGTPTVGGKPDFESFKTRFKYAAGPWVTSQTFGGRPKNLFRVHLRDAGAAATNYFKVSIENIIPVSNTSLADQYGTFDLLLRRLSDTDGKKETVEKFLKMSLNPKDERYIGRIIGDMNTYYDFDQVEGSQKLVVDGLFPNMSRNIRVEIADDVANAIEDQTALPIGFRGPSHLVTSGSSIMNFVDINRDSGFNPISGSYDISADIMHRVVQPPIPFRYCLSVGKSPRLKVDADLFWGVKFEINDHPSQPNGKQLFNPAIMSFSKYFPDYDESGQTAWAGNNAGAADKSGTVYDSDRFNNNGFSLENVQVKLKGAIGSTTDYPDKDSWQHAKYRRNGGLIYDANLVPTTSRFLNISKDFSVQSSQRFLKFSFFLLGGFDGVDVFNEDKANLANVAAKREVDDSTNQGGLEGPTVQAYRRAIDVLEERSNADIQLLAIPGARHSSITDYAMDAVTDRFDAMYIMDLEERDTQDNVVTGSQKEQPIGVGNTARAFKSRNLDTSFTAAYFPDVVLTDPATLKNVTCPPSVAVLGAYALNDAVAHPWFAPAGFTRGVLSSVVNQAVMTSRANLDTLYEAKINTITAFPASPGAVIFGQKTLLAAQSALDRVNVRRLLIEVRRRVRGVANVVLFEPNREATLARFSAAVQPILGRIQAQQGLDRFKVVIDSTTTTQADIENNTIRGKIFLQPTRSVEFISLDFVVTNQGGTDI